MNTCKNAYVRFLQLLRLWSSLKRLQNHLCIQRRQLRRKDKPCQPLKALPLQSWHYLQSQSHLQDLSRREALSSQPFKVSILQSCQGPSKESLGLLAQKLQKLLYPTQPNHHWSEEVLPVTKSANSRRCGHLHAKALPLQGQPSCPIEV